MSISIRCLLQYDNAKATVRRRDYKREFYDLPTVDHVGDGLGLSGFAICSWQVNDAKRDQTYDEFLQVCRAVVIYNECGEADEQTDAPKTSAQAALSPHTAPWPT